MDQLYRMAKASNKRFPKGVEPFQMATRLLEEAGEVAREINHFEDSGLKRQKYGEPKKENIANELRQVMVECCKIAMYYGVEQELQDAIEANLKRAKQDGLLD